MEAAEGAGMSRPTLPMRKRRRNLLVLLLLGHASYFTLRVCRDLGLGVRLEAEGELRSNRRSRSSRGGPEKDRRCLARWFQILQEKHG